ncbi:MAG: CoA-binding protein [Ignavibacteriaceae bacterium]
MLTKKEIDNFFDSGVIAVAGVSRSGKKFGATVFKELKRKGFTVYPVNPSGGKIGDEKLYTSLSEIEDKVEALVTVVPKEKTIDVVKEAISIGIEKIWMQQGSESQEAIDYCIKNKIVPVTGECILMFAEPTTFIHSAHKWINKVIGKLPA